MSHLLKSLRARLVLLIILVAIPGVILLVVDAFDERNDAFHSALQRAVATVDLLVSDQAKLIDETQQYLQRLAQFPELLNPDSAECGAFLSKVLGLTARYVNLGVPRADGELLCNALPLNKRVNVADRGYIKRSLATRGFAIGEFQMDRAAGVTSVNFSYPVINPANDQVVGIAVAVVSLEWWSKRLAETRLPDNSLAYIADADNKIIAHYPVNNERLGMPLSQLKIDTSLAEEISGHSVVVAKDFDGKTRIFASRQLVDSESSRPVIFSVGIPFGEEMAMIESRLAKAGLLLLAFIGLMFVVALWGVWISILKPLKLLSISTKELESGKHVSQPLLTGSAELVDLQRRFARMAETRLKAEQDLRDSQVDLRNSENYIRALFDSIPIGLVLCSLDGEFVDINPAFAKIIGYSVEEAKTLSYWDITPKKFRLEEAQQLEALEATGSYGPYEKKYHHKDGHLVPVRLSGMILERGGNKFIWSSVEDITEHKQAEGQLLNLRNYLSNIIDSMPSMLIGVDKQCCVTQWNIEAQHRTGLSSKEVMGQPLDRVIPRLAVEMQSIRDAIESRQEQIDSKRLYKQNGENRYENVTIYPLIASGVEGAVIRVDDITRRVHLEEMMVQSEKMLSVGGLAAGMAHEINNPLAGMMQTASVISNRLTGKATPANVRAAEAAGTSMEAIDAFMADRGILQMLTSINESGQRLAAIVGNMLSFARKSTSASDSHDMSELLDKTLELAATDYDLKKQFDFKAINIVREYADNLPLLSCEGAKIQQVLLNLLRNGAQAMQDAGVDNPTFTLRTIYAADRDMACIEIEDNGPGLDEASRKRVFEPFYTTKKVGLGTGLGLSVSYFIITENHGGEMSVESEPGKGARFIIHLPLLAKEGEINDLDENE